MFHIILQLLRNITLETMRLGHNATKLHEEVSSQVIENLKKKYADLNKVLKNLSTTVFCRCGHLSFLALVVVVRCLFCFFQLFFSMLFAYGDVYMK